MTADADFLGFRFARGSRAELTEQILRRCRAPFSFVITPNVDFVTRAANDAGIKALYDQAAVQMCDSRILALLAQWRGVSLDCYPGSDFVADLLRQPGDRSIAIIGPGHDDRARLGTAFPQADLHLIPSPAMMSPGDAQWDGCVRDAAAARWDILLICLGSPKQERLAVDIGRVREQTGVALCVGAAVDFLTGQQRRAPQWMQRAHLEWLHRLVKNPGRLWRRYLVDGPRIFFLTIRYR